MNGRRTLRGQFTEGEVKRLILDDGRLNYGYRVVSWFIAPDPAGNAAAFATLSLDYDSPLAWNWGDNRQIGWASSTTFNVPGPEVGYVAIDPGHIVLQDLYIQGQVGPGGGNDIINYLIELEPLTLTDDEAIITLIKERSQDDQR